jgi:anaerobic magnesium-protoporphyrin IX monomethyl ester cyclase
MDLLATCSDILLIGNEDEENLSMRSVAAFLMNAGIRVGIEPYKSGRKEAILRRIIKDNPTIIGYSISFQAMIPDFAELTDYLRKNGVSRHITAGGHIPTIAPETVFEMMPELDTVVRHEGELTLPELYKNVDKPDLWPGIRGLVVRRNGVIEVTPPRPLIEDLDTLPFPVRSDSFETFRGLGIGQMLASRGCPYQCSFCSIHQFYSDAIGRKRRLRSPLNVVHEMKQLFQQGVRIFIFVDDGLITRSRSGRRWAEEFAQALKKSGLTDEIIWSMFCRVDEVDADILGRLKDCGLGFVGIGIESGNEQGLKTLNKRYAVDDIFRSMDIVHRLELGFEYGFMMFDPDSTFQSIKANLAFLERLCESGNAPVRLTKMVPLMATPITRRLQEQGRLVGTIDSPNFTYEDNRLDLLDLFFARAFGSAFGRNGLIDRLRSAVKDAVILAKFFTGRYDARAYGESITGLITAFNDSAFETLYKAVQFMENRSEEDILYYWYLLDMLCRQELESQADITKALEKTFPAEIQV